MGSYIKVWINTQCKTPRFDIGEIFKELIKNKILVAFLSKKLYVVVL
jgi:hypothetical protein